MGTGNGDPVAPQAASRAALGRLQERVSLHRFLAAFARQVGARGGTAWLVGGIVRDILEGRPGNDVDVMVTGIGFAELGRALGSLPARRLGIRKIVAAGKTFPVYRVRTSWTAEDVDVATARGTPDLFGDTAPLDIGPDAHLAQARADLSRRDLTINALALRLDIRSGRLRGELVDFFGGVWDLRRRLVRGVGDPAARLAEDPLRILRAIRQKNERPGFAFERRTWEAIRAGAPELLGSVPADRIAPELARALGAGPGGTLDDLARAGILRLLIPEWKNLRAGALARARRRFASLRKSLRGPLRPPLLFACLLAEIADAEYAAILNAAARGKSREQARGLSAGRSGGKATAPDRDRGFHLPGIEAIARRLRLPDVRTIVRMLEDLVRLERIRLLPNPNARVEAIFARWKNRDELLALYGAAQRAAGRKARDFRAVLRLASRRPPLLSGDDLVSAGIPPGPAIDAILESVREATITGRVANERDALALARRLIARRSGDAAARPFRQAGRPGQKNQYGNR